MRFLMLALLSLPGLASAVSPAALAEEADLVAVAVVEQVDYQKTRIFPSSGSGYLRLLIVYKGEDLNPGDWIEVKEKGLGDEKCYYPEPDPFAFEGARFFVFLREEDGAYRGVAPGCKIPVYVTSENQYAVRHPVDGLTVPDDKVQEMTFSDPAAVVDAGDFTSTQVEELKQKYHAEFIEPGPMEPNFQRYRYTQGIPLTEFRRLAFPEE